MGGVTGAGRPERRHRRGQRGFVLAFFCIAITALLAFAAFCVDLGNWYFHIQLEQRAADSAALAGAAHLPADPNSGVTDATQVMGIDGFTATPSQITINAYPLSSQPDHMYVSVTQNVHNVFLSIFGFKSINLTRVAIAVNKPPMLFGSPDNVLGAEPPGTDIEGGPAVWGDPNLKQGDYFLQLSAPGSLKANGAQWTAGSCLTKQNLGTGNGASTVADLCGGGPIPTSNQEFDKDGDTYKLHVPPGVSGKMAVDLYDPSFVDTETVCNDNISLGGGVANPADPWQRHLPVNGNPNIWEFDPSGSNPGLGGVLDPPAEKYCDGDREELGGNIPKAFNTEYWITYPNSKQKVPGCDVTYGGWEPQYDGLNKITTADNDPKSIYNTFHKWARLCNLNVGGANPVGDYVLHANIAYPQGGTVPVGTNDFSLRIAIMNGAGAGETLDPQTYKLYILDGNNHMEATSVGLGTNPQYYLGQILPDLVGQTIKLKYFDLGDNAQTTLHILPPRDATVNGTPISQWPSCTAYAFNGTTEVGPAMPAPSCSYTMQNRQYDGTTIEMQVHVPQGYSCGVDGKEDDCWFQAVQEYTGVGGNGLNAIDDYWSVSSNFEEQVLHITH